MKVFKQTEIKEAAKILKNGGLIAFPTETVFGFGVIYNNKKAYDDLISVKRRSPEQPFTLMLSKIEDIKKYAKVNMIAEKLINKFMPGQITLILEAKDELPEQAKSKVGTVGIRIPDFPLIQKLIEEVGEPLLVPSANRHGEIPCKNSNEVVEIFKNEIDGVVEGESVSNIASTIVIINENSYKIIREGVITKDDIESVLED